MYKNIIISLALFAPGVVSGKCLRANYKHAYDAIRLCRYYQENIYNNYAKKMSIYPETERLKECFFCGCPIDEHNKQPLKPQQKKRAKT